MPSYEIGMRILGINDASPKSSVWKIVKNWYVAVKEVADIDLINLDFTDLRYEIGKSVAMNKFNNDLINRIYSAVFKNVNLELEDYDIVHGMDGMTPFFVKRMDVVTFHHVNPLQNWENYDNVTRIMTRLAVFKASQIGAVIFQSYYARDLFLKNSKSKVKTFVVYPYYINKYLLNKVTREKAREMLGLPTDENILIAVGTSIKYKNFDTLYNAVRGTDIKVLRIGGDRRMESERLGWNIPENVIFLGTGDLSDETVAYAYISSDALVFTSTDEGFGLPMMEGMSLGLPIIGVKATTVPEIVGDAGIVIEDPFNPSAMKNAIMEIIRNKDEYSLKSINRSQLFSKERFKEKIKLIYESI